MKTSSNNGPGCGCGCKKTKTQMGSNVYGLMHRLTVLTLSLLLIAVITGSVSATSVTYAPTDGLDVKPGSQSHMTSGNLAKFVSSDDQRYERTDQWPKSDYDNSYYMLLNFTPSIPSGAVINSVTLKFEYQRELLDNPNGGGKIIVSNGAGWSSPYYVINSGDDDVTHTIDLSSYLNTPEKINKAALKFLAYGEKHNTNNGMKTKHDWAVLIIDYSPGCTPTGVLETICNGVDDDCDGAIDEDYVPVTSCFLPGVCAAGNAASTCVSGVETACHTGTPTGSDDNCNGINEDCDASTDEHYVATPTSCGLGVCASTGSLVCVSGATQNTCTPGTPTGSDNNCNGINEDCDASTDEHYVATPTSCGLGACASTGSTSCVSGSVIDSCTAGTSGTEVCDLNQIDEDCDGTSNEGCSCIDGDTRSCGSDVGECSTGLQTCAGGVWGTTCAGEVTPVTESCNGLDDDCDETVDNGFTDLGETCYAGDGECRAAGEMVCAQDGLSTVCDAVPGSSGTEVCDGLDNDCDKTVDNGGNALCSTDNECLTPVCNGLDLCGTAPKETGTVCVGSGPVTCEPECQDPGVMMDYFTATGGDNTCDGQGNCVDYQCVVDHSTCDLTCGATAASQSDCASTCGDGEFTTYTYNPSICSCDANNPTSCDDGLFCNGQEGCDTSLGCQPGTAPCSGLCNEVTDSCVSCLQDTDCNDQNACTLDTCNIGLELTPSVAFFEVTLGTCSHTPIESCCNTNSDCASNNILACGDGGIVTSNYVCVEHSCVVDEGNSGFVSCEDQLFCNGQGTCQETDGGPQCVSGSNACLESEVCDEELNVCATTTTTTTTLAPGPTGGGGGQYQVSTREYRPTEEERPVGGGGETGTEETVETTPTTQPAPPATQPAPPTTLRGSEENRGNVQSQPTEEQPGIVGYAALPIDYGAGLQSGGLRNLLILLILLAGYIIWAEDTRRMKNSMKKK